jgi:ABC-type iron transport system FetAB ATPase subunit
MLTIRKLARHGLGPIDLDIADGECIALSGPSGAGKTLFLRAIADLDPNDGALGLDGEDRQTLAAPEWRRRVAYLAAESGWWTDDTGGHFADTLAAIALLPELGLAADALEWPVARLSTGERQRLALIRLLIGGPRVMLLDEPTSALDDDATRAVEALIRRRLAAGVAALVVSHDGGQAERLGARRLYLAGGVLREDAP